MDNYRLLNGKELAAKVLARIRSRVDEESSRRGRRPGLAVILVGEDPASKAYVSNKERTAKQKCGFETFNSLLPADAADQQLAEQIAKYNADDRVDGILLQLPLPKHLDSSKFLNLILPGKDVDGLHPYNQGLLMGGQEGPLPCTPAGIMELLDLAYADPSAAELPRADLSGKRAVVVGRSILVGKPVALLLLQRHATVIMAHSRTPDLPALCRTADIVVAAAGVPQLVRGDWIGPGAVVIDVGINRLEDGRLTGDVAFDEAKEVAYAITPVPGGVGPMTVAMLMRNTLNAYLRSA